MTGPSLVRDRTHHRCHSCFAIWSRRRRLWTRILTAAGHARVDLVRPVRCVVCGFQAPRGARGYVLVSLSPRVTDFVCAPCHEDCHSHFGGLPRSVAELLLRPLAAPPGADAPGALLVVRYPIGFPALAAAARRLAYEFVCDFPLAPVPYLRTGGATPGLLEGLLHVSPDRFAPEVLLPLAEAAIVALDCRRVRLAYPSAVRRAVAGTIYDQHGASARRRLVAG